MREEGEGEGGRKSCSGGEGSEDGECPCCGHGCEWQALRQPCARAVSSHQIRRLLLIAIVLRLRHAGPACAPASSSRNSPPHTTVACRLHCYQG